MRMRIICANMHIISKFYYSITGKLIMLPSYSNAVSVYQFLQKSISLMNSKICLSDELVVVNFKMQLSNEMTFHNTKSNTNLYPTEAVSKQTKIAIIM